MTREEAVELVLNGDPWDTCVTCFGSGTGFEGEGDDRRLINCWSCRGEGHYLPEAALEAYHMLGVAPPPRPLTIREAVAADIGTFVSDAMNEKTVDRLKRFGIIVKEYK